MAVVTRWYARDTDRVEQGPFKTKAEAASVILLPEEEQLAQNRTNQKHSRVWSEYVAVNDDGDKHVLYTPHPPKAVYFARIPDPSKLLPFASCYSQVSPEAAVALLKKIVTLDGRREFPDDEIEVHVYRWDKSAMTVLPAEETTDPDE